MKTAKIINLIGGIIAMIFAGLSAVFSQLTLSLAFEMVDATDPMEIMEQISGVQTLAVLLLMFIVFIMFIYGIVAIVFNVKAQMTLKPLGIVGGSFMIVAFIYFFVPVINVIAGLIIGLLFFLGFFLPKEKTLYPPMGDTMNNDQQNNQGPTFE